MENAENFILIKPPGRLFNLGFKELWRYRELIYFFVWRDIKVRYKQTAVGVLWAVFQPLFAMIVFTLFFGRFAKMPSDGIPYPIFVYVGLLLWNYFSFSLTHASNSMVSNAAIIQKIYFPRLIIPVASSFVGLVDFCIASLILIGLMLHYHYTPNIKGLLYVPLLVLISFLSSVGLGCFLASINVKYRDIRYVMPFFIQMMMYLTPVIYPVSIAGEKFKWLLLLNPMSGVIETARAVILGSKNTDLSVLFTSLAISIVLFIFGILYFRKTESYFADII